MTSHVKRVVEHRFYLIDARAGELSRTFGCVGKAGDRALTARTRPWPPHRERGGHDAGAATPAAWQGFSRTGGR